MTNSKSHPNYYSESYHRGEVQKQNWGRVGEAAGIAGGTVGAAHLIGNIQIPASGYRKYMDLAKGTMAQQADFLKAGVDPRMVNQVAKESMKHHYDDTLGAAPKKSINDMIKHIDEAVKEAGKQADDAAAKATKALRSKQLTGLRVGKWGSAIAGGLAVGAVAKKVAGDAGQAHGVASGPNEDQQKWAEREETRRSVTVNLENGR